jgi:hypothetical protein
VQWADLACYIGAGNYYDQSAQDNISPCQNLDDYNPYNYQEWAQVRCRCSGTYMYGVC